MFRLANRVSDKLAWPRSRALNTGAEAAVVDVEDVVSEPPITAAELLAAAAETEPEPTETTEPAPDVVVDGFET